jgi:hypothetical protein
VSCRNLGRLCTQTPVCVSQTRPPTRPLYEGISFAVKTSAPRCTRGQQARA